MVQQIALCVCFPVQLLHLFTDSAAIIAEGQKYLTLVQWTFALFIITNILMAALRSVGTLIARIIELVIVVIYILKFDKKLMLFKENIFRPNRQLRHDYKKVVLPIMMSQVLWGVSVPMQTAILGHMSADAIAANSVATTFYQYLKVIVIMSFIMVGMSYQMPVSFGIIQGGGDTGFTMKMNMISTWLIVMPLSFMAAFWWHWPVEAVVIVIQSDQIFKGLPTFIRFRSYKWIKKMTN